ncbi:MAG: hypothetical protein JXA25_02395 [Anaerolineales bacterium]|nr:hypothetical protein [Anaerolineales bacterium]
MEKHLYLSLIPEALVVSMLSPEEFGIYYAVGSAKKSRGAAIFFEVDPAYRHEKLRIEEALERCEIHEDGTPKASIYASVYRVMEYISLDALMQLYLVTPDGRVLGLEPGSEFPEETEGMHLYQEIAPVHPQVVSNYGPLQFYELIVKNPTSLISLPVVCFVELRLNGLAVDPLEGDASDLPYSGIEHLRGCLTDLKTKPFHSKMVDRVHPASFPFRMIKNGVFIGNEQELKYFPMLSTEELRAKHYRFWRSINM